MFLGGTVLGDSSRRQARTLCACVCFDAYIECRCLFYANYRETEMGGALYFEKATRKLWCAMLSASGVLFHLWCAVHGIE